MATYPPQKGIVAISVCNDLADADTIVGQWAPDDYVPLRRWLEVELVDGVKIELPMPKHWENIWDLYVYARTTLSKEVSR